MTIVVPITARASQALWAISTMIILLLIEARAGSSTVGS